MSWLIAIPALPAAVFGLFAVIPRRTRARLQLLPPGVAFATLGLALLAFAQTWPGGAEEPVWHGSLAFGVLGGQVLTLSMALDPVGAVMLLVVTIVAACVQVYSLAYMKGEPREGWFFGVLSLFTAAMLLLVLSSDLLLTFMAWELMGLCSYLLIGFWFETTPPRRAARKAFITTRIGDIGFLFALAIVYERAGTFAYEAVLESAAGWPAGALAVAGLGLVVAAMGKSAQLPLHVWLPDAMAGPTPSSALIHAATMVAAGVFVVARMLPLVSATEWVSEFVLYVGTATALLGGMLACIQHDVKKVLAYSTISQLGYMFVALGAGSSEAALFHLTTHAFFKSLLFLGAGVIIHAAHTQDMRLMGGLGRKMPVTATAFGIGTLALAGVFPLSGFFSKDEIVATLVHGGHPLVVALVMTTSGLTAFYVARLLFRVFSGPHRTKLSEGGPLMLAPMVALAGITLVLGWASPAFARFLGGHGAWPEPGVAIPSLVVAIAGLSAGWWLYGRSSVVVNTRVYKERFSRSYGVLERAFFFDSVYEALVVHPFERLAEKTAGLDRSVVDGLVGLAVTGWSRASRIAWRFDDAAVDGLVNAIARADVWTSGALERLEDGIIDRAVNGFAARVRQASAVRLLQSGNTSTYVTAFALAVVVLAWVFAR